MTFIVTLIALLIERFFDWSHLRNWGWYDAYQEIILKRFPNKQAYLTLAFFIVPLILIVGVVNWLLNGWMYGVLKLVFQLVVLLYCMGPRSLWADTFACINALTQGDVALAGEKLKTMFGITDTSDAQNMHKQLVSSIFVEANRRVFAVAFWYAILGPVGAVLYRLMTITALESAKEGMSTELMQRSRFIETILDWVPVRAFTFLFALGGHFARVLSCWSKQALLGLSSNEALLTDCGFAALGEDQAKVATDGSMERNEVSLLDRVFVILLVIVAVAVLIF